MPIKMRPLHDFVVIKRSDSEAQSKGGLYIPETSQEKSVRGEVLAVGPGRRTENGTLIPPDSKVGDRVIVQSKYHGTDVEIDNEKYLVLRDTEVAAVEEP